MSTLEVLALAVVILLGNFLLNNFVSPYLKKRGEDLATKKNLAEITDKVESIKADHTRGLELLRATIGSASHIRQVRYEREYNILMELTEKVFEFRCAVQNLRPLIGEVDEDKAQQEFKKTRWALVKFEESRKPFFSDGVYLALRDLEQVAWSEFVQFQMYSDPDLGYNRTPKPKDYWEKMVENTERIDELSEAVVQRIRERVKYWESFDLKLDAQLDEAA